MTPAAAGDLERADMAHSESPCVEQCESDGAWWAEFAREALRRKYDSLCL